MTRLFLLVLLVLTIAVSPVMAQDDASTVTIAPGETVQLGLVASLSGEVLPEAGADIRNAAQIAVDLFNEAGALQGFQVELVVEDDQCDPEQATTIANNFATETRLVGVVGHMCSGATIVGSEVYEEARIVVVSPSATAGSVTGRGLTVMNRTAFSDAAQGVVAARYIANELGVTSIAVLHDNSDYGKGLAETVAATFVDELGGELVAEVQGIDPAEQDYRSVLTVLAGNEPELLYFGGYQNEAALLVSQMAEVGMEDTIFFSGDGVKVQAYLDLAGDAAEGSYVTFGTSVGVSEEDNAEFDALYEETFGVAPDDLGPFHAQAFDAAAVILTALMDVATVDDAGNLVIDREALIAAVRATSGFEGLSGAITCNENGDCGAGLIQVFLVEGGEFVEQEVPAELQLTAVTEDGAAEPEATAEPGS